MMTSTDIKIRRYGLTLKGRLLKVVLNALFTFPMSNRSAKELLQHLKVSELMESYNSDS